MRPQMGRVANAEHTRQPIVASALPLVDLADALRKISAWMKLPPFHAAVRAIVSNAHQAAEKKCE